MLFLFLHFDCYDLVIYMVKFPPKKNYTFVYFLVQIYAMKFSKILLCLFFLNALDKVNFRHFFVENNHGPFKGLNKKSYIKNIINLN